MRIPVSNPGLKALSVLLAVILWYAVVSKGSSEVSIEVPLEFKNIPKNHELVWESTESVTLRVSGHEQRLKRVGPGTVSVFIDLGGAGAGETAHLLSRENVRVPGNVTVLKIEPSEVHVRLEEVATRTVPVVPTLAGEPVAGLEVGRVRMEPARVEITGAKAFISSLQNVKTAVVDVSGWTAGERTVTVAVDTTGTSYRVAPTKVDVHVEIRSALREEQ